MKGSDSRLLRLLNAQRIIDAIFEAAPQGMSRADMVRATGLSKPTVSALVAELEEAGLLRLAAISPVTGAIGRPGVLYEVVPEAGFVVGADIGATKIIVGVADLLGRVLEEREIPTGPDAEAAVGRLSEAAAEMLAGRGTAGAACVGVPGIYRPATDRVDQALNLPGFGELAVRTRLTELLGIDVHVDNDVNLAALGEANRAEEDFEPQTFAAISVGTGIGMGLIVDGELYRGGTAAAGEIGSLVMSRTEGRSETRVTLEDLASASAMRKLFLQALEEGHQSVLAGTADVPDILEAAADGDPAAARVLSTAAAAMALAVSHVCLIADPTWVVFGGGVGANPVFVGAVGRELSVLDAEPIRVVPSTLGRRATFLGAISRALSAVHETLVTESLGSAR